MKWDNNLQTQRLVHAAFVGGDAGLVRATEHVRGVSDTLVPFEEGVLEGSGKPSEEHPMVDVERSVNGTSQTSIVYATPYARKQHEDMNLKHPNGRTAKYLEGPLATEAGTARDMMARGVQEAL